MLVVGSDEGIVGMAKSQKQKDAEQGWMDFVNDRVGGRVVMVVLGIAVLAVVVTMIGGLL